MEVIFGVFFPYASQPIRLEILLLLPSKYIIGHLLPPLLVLDTVTSCFSYYHSLLTSLPPWLLALYSKHNSQSDIFKWGFRSCHFLNTCVDIHFSQNEDYNFKLSIMSYTICSTSTSLTSCPIILNLSSTTITSTSLNPPGIFLKSLH